jgi:peptide chain release factor 2
LWNDSKQAQEVMRERRRLDEAIGATRAIQQELDDTIELMEMAEAENDDGLVDDAVTSLAALAERSEQDKVKALLAGEADPNDAYIEVNAGAEEPKARIGPRCCSACTPAGPSATA